MIQTIHLKKPVLKILRIVFSLAVICTGLAFGQQDICSRSDVVFCSGWESKNENLIWQHQMATNKMLVDPGPFNISSNHVAQLNESQKDDFYTVLPAGYDKLYMRWYVKWEAGFDFNQACHQGGIHGGISSNTTNGMGSSNAPLGDDWFTSKMEACFGRGFSSSTYYVGQSLGNPAILPVGSRPYPRADQWYCVEVMVDAGTPTFNGNTADGQLGIWVDGTQTALVKNMWWRKVADLKAQVLWMSMYFHHGTGVNGAGYRVDDVVASTNYIGCGTRVDNSNVQLTISITTPQLNAGKVDSSYAAYLKASGSVTSYSWNVTSGSLPPGLSLVQATGRIFGIPTQAGTYTFTLQATDKSVPPLTAQKQFTMQINSNTGIISSQGPVEANGIAARVRKDRLLLEFSPNCFNGEIRLFNALGYTVWEQEIKTGISSAASPVLPMGVYMGMMNQKGKTTSFRFAIIR